jgi:hypothetical protein
VCFESNQNKNVDSIIQYENEIQLPNKWLTLGLYTVSINMTWQGLIVVFIWSCYRNNGKKTWQMKISFFADWKRKDQNLFYVCQ